MINLWIYGVLESLLMCCKFFFALDSPMNTRLCGYPPFYGDSHVELFEKITHAKYTFPEPEWDFISDTAKDFIRNLLSLDASKRMTADQCLQHSFLVFQISKF
jgi:serine/threonine protein kinase